LNEIELLWLVIYVKSLEGGGSLGKYNANGLHPYIIFYFLISTQCETKIHTWISIGIYIYIFCYVENFFLIFYPCIYGLYYKLRCFYYAHEKI